MQHLNGSDAMGFMTRDLILTFGLGSGNDPLVTPCPDTDALCYDGGVRNLVIYRLAMPAAPDKA